MSGPDGLVHRVRPAAGAAEGMLVLFHGRGTSEHDLFGLLDELDPDRRLVGVTPRGPLTMPPGGAHWYGVREVGFPDPETFEVGYRAAAGWLAAIADELDVPMSRTILGGFSQGAVMSYALGLGAGRSSPAGILAMSGFIPTVTDWEADLDSRAGLPVNISHGTLDPVISVEFAREARTQLEPAGLDVEYAEWPVPHTVDPGAITGLRAWVGRTCGLSAQ